MLSRSIDLPLLIVLGSYKLKKGIRTITEKKNVLGIDKHGVVKHPAVKLHEDWRE